MLLKNMLNTSLSMIKSLVTISVPAAMNAYLIRAALMPNLLLAVYLGIIVNVIMLASSAIKWYSMGQSTIAQQKLIEAQTRLANLSAQISEDPVRAAQLNLAKTFNNKRQELQAEIEKEQANVNYFKRKTWILNNIVSAIQFYLNTC